MFGKFLTYQNQTCLCDLVLLNIFLKKDIQNNSSNLHSPYQAGTASLQRIRPRIIFSQRVCKLFCDIRDKSAVFNILRQNVTIFDIGNGQRGRKQTENEEILRVNLSLHFLILSPFPHSLSISSSFSHSLSIFSQPGFATICATLTSFNIIQCFIITVNCGDQEILPMYV